MLVLVAAACGDGSGSSGSGDAVRVATVARSTDAAGTARFETTVTDGDGRSGFFSRGVVDFVRDRTSGENRSGSGEQQPVSHSITVDGVTYSDLRGPDSVPGKPWRGFRMLARRGGLLASPSVGDVTALVTNLDRAGGKAEVLGSEDVRGESTTHSRYTFDGGPQPREVAMTGSGYPGPLVIDIWSDAQHRLRRFRVSQGPTEYAQVVDTEFFDFGVPADIEAPPPDQVADVTTADEPTSWTVVQQGRAGDVGWRVYRGPIAGGQCLAYATVPPAATATLLPGDGEHASASCSSSSSSSSSSSASASVSSSVSSGTSSSASSTDISASASSSASSSGSGSSSGSSTGFVDDVLDEIEQSVVGLPNGMALFFADVPASVHRVVAHVDGGGTRDNIPVQGVFAFALGPDEIVTQVDLVLADRTLACRYRKDDGFFGCHRA